MSSGDPVTPGNEPSRASRLGATLGRTVASAAVGTRASIRRNPTANRVYRTGVGVIGGSTVALGVVMMPLPGPGTLVAMGGLGILGTEFEGAKKVNQKVAKVAKRVAGKARDAIAERRARKDEPKVDYDDVFE